PLAQRGAQFRRPPACGQPQPARRRGGAGTAAVLAGPGRARAGPAAMNTTPTSPTSANPASASPRRLLIVEDDAAFARTLGRSFERRGYEVRHAASQADLEPLLQEYSPRYAVVDLKLAGGSSGLSCVQALHAHDPQMLIVVLTGYASIATAVEAIKLGACHYLAKPSNTDDIEAAFGKA